MRRRDILAGVGSLGVLAGGGVLATGGVPSFDEADDARGSDGSESNEPIVVQTVDATGSEAGTLEIPNTGTVTFVDFFATTCEVCKAMMPTLAEANDRVDDVTFVSVTSPIFGPEETDEELAEWWDEYDGQWLLARDDDHELFERHDVVGTPTSVVFDADGEVHWRDEGRKDVDDLVETIESAR